MYKSHYDILETPFTAAPHTDILKDLECLKIQSKTELIFITLEKNMERIYAQVQGT